MTQAATAKRVTRADLVERIEHVQEQNRAWVRRQVLEFDRVDVLCTEVLGYEVQRHHLAMMQHQFLHPDGNLCLAWRGCGKTSVRTIAYGIHRLLKDPNDRILLASKSSTNAQAMLSEIKRHLEGERLRYFFGPQVGRKWDESEITVLARTSPAKEPSITTVGIDSAVASRHYDCFLADDIVTEEEARTAYMRRKTLKWWYKSVLPCLEPGGVLTINGNPYHHQDLYAHFRAHEMKGIRTLIVPSMVGNDTEGWTATWAEKFSVPFLLGLREKMGSILFMLQYLCDASRTAGGGVFKWDDVVFFDAIPEGLPTYLGADLAISLKERADLFAIVTIRFDPATDKVYVVDYRTGRLTFYQQRETVIEMADRHKIVRGAIESNQFQAGLFQEVKRKRPDLPLFPVEQRESKEVRAYRLAARFEGGRVLFRRGLDTLASELVEFPDAPHDHGFDALELAIRAVRVRQRKKRREVGLI